jgi:hypothetical protein
MDTARSTGASTIAHPASAVTGQVPPAGPQWQRGLSQPRAAALGYDKPLCASLDGFTLHAATRPGALHLAGREALLRYVLRPPLAQRDPQSAGARRIARWKSRDQSSTRVGSSVLASATRPGDAARSGATDAF